jgi:stage II sporulation protein P
MTYFAGFFNAIDVARTQDNTRNVVAVGDAIAGELSASGISVIHDTTVHDYPQYTGAYDRSATTIQNYLDEYPSICVVLDIHRDSICRVATERVKPTVVIDEKKAAQMMIIAGVSDSSSLPHPDWEENLRFALRLQSALSTHYEGIMRPLYLVDSRYNEHLTHGSLLIEIGSDTNTVSEAVYSGQILGKTLSEVLSSLTQ